MSLEKFAETTTLHGLPHVVQSETTKGKLFWAVICLFSLGAFGYYSYRILHRFLQYDKSVAIEVLKTETMFPQMTLCNLNPISEKFMIDTRQNLESAPMETKKVFVNFVEHYERYRRITNQFVQIFKSTGFTQAEFRDYRRYQQSRSGFARFLGLNLITQASIPDDMFVLQCTYQTSTCNYTIKEVFDAFFYRCVTLTFTDLTGGPLAAKRAGMDNGISLWLYAGLERLQDENFIFNTNFDDVHQPLSESDGLRLVVQSNGMYPFPLSQGYIIAPGTHTSIGFKTTHIKRIKEPYGKCREPEQNYYQNYTYSVALCEAMCNQKVILQQCGCMDISYPLLKNQNASLCLGIEEHLEQCKRKPCDIKLKEESKKIIYDEYSCLRNLIELFTLEKCECYPPCEETTQNFETSSVKWPRGVMQGTLYTEAMNRLETEVFKDVFVNTSLRSLSGKEKDETAKLFLSNTAKVTMYLSDRNSVEVTESPGYEEAQMIADLGGMLGLAIGMSVITIVEIIQFTVFCCPCFNRKKQISNLNSKVAVSS